MTIYEVPFTKLDHTRLEAIAKYCMNNTASFTARTLSTFCYEYYGAPQTEDDNIIFLKYRGYTAPHPLSSKCVVQPVDLSNRVAYAIEGIAVPGAEKLGVATKASHLMHHFIGGFLAECPEALHN